jgi:FlaA1/EpsC-like NDP-sugar epimerase
VADFCEGAAARWGISLTGLDVVMTKPRLLVVGAGGHGRSVAEAVLMSGDFDLVGFLDDGAFASGFNVWGLPVLGPATAFADYAAMA